MTADSGASALSRYRARGETEVADLERVRALLSSDDPWLRSTALHFTGSAVIVHPPSQRVLLRWHERQEAWLQVGGHADPGEADSLDVALREAREETGLDDLVPWPDPAIVHIVIVGVPAAPHEGAHEHADVRYILATSRPDAARPENPRAALRWMSVQEAYAMTTEDNLRETLTRVGRLLSASPVHG